MLNNPLKHYFPQLVQQLGWLLILFSVLGIINAIPMPNLLITVPILVVGLIFSFTTAGVVLDLDHKRLKQYVGLFGLKVGSWEQLPPLKEVVFTSSSYSQQIHAIVSRRSLHSKEFRAFLKGENHKILFSAGKNAQSVKNDARAAAESLLIPAIDYTVKPPFTL